MSDELSIIEEYIYKMYSPSGALKLMNWVIV
jgi:hypothetical protein